MLTYYEISTEQLYYECVLGRPSPPQSRAEVTHHESVLHEHAVTDIDNGGSLPGPPQKWRRQEKQNIEERWCQCVEGVG